MANPYTKKYTFRDKMNGAGDTLRYTITFTVDEEGTDQEFLCEDVNIFLSSRGELEWDWDIKEFLMVPGELQIEIADLDGIFDEYSFGAPNNIQKDGELKLEIKYNGDEEFTEEFAGHIIPEQTGDAPEKKKFNVSAAVDTDKLNEAMLADEDGFPVITLGYAQNDKSYAFIKTIIEKCYQYVNPAIVFDYIHNWELKVTEAIPIINQLVLSGYDYQGNIGLADDFKLEHIRYLTDKLFYNPDSEIESLGSLLRKLAFDWGAVTGMLTNNKCFFRQVFSNPEYVEITDDMIRNEYNEYSYIPVSSIYISTYTNYSVRAGRQEKYTKLEDRYINEELLPEITDPTAIHFPYIIGKRSNIDYFIYRVQTETIGDRSFERAVSDHPFLLRDQLKQLRGRITAPVKVFELKGINYVFLSDYVRNGVRYSPVNVKKNLDETVTTVSCIRNPLYES